MKPRPGLPQLALILFLILLTSLAYPAPGKIVSYQDDQGVWRIYNQQPQPEEARGGAPAVPAAGTAGAAGQPREPERRPLAGGIRCYTDARGVIRITNVGAVASPPADHPGGAAAGAEGKTAGLPLREPAASSQPAAAAPAAGRQARGQLRRYGQIFLVQDAQGRYRIFNAVQTPAEPAGTSSVAAAETLSPVISAAARRYRLDPALIKAVIKAESNFARQARSPKGALGLMQLMPGTADFLGVANPFCPVENIYGGSRYLRLLLDCFNGDPELALAAYNAGFQRVIKAGFKIPGLRETEEFVRRVLKYWRLYRQQDQEMASAF